MHRDLPWRLQPFVQVISVTMHTVVAKTGSPAETNGMWSSITGKDNGEDLLWIRYPIVQVKLFAAMASRDFCEAPRGAWHAAAVGGCVSC